MTFYYVRNVNDAFRRIVSDIQEGIELPLTYTSSRAGDVIQITEPVCIRYSHPCERVLFNRERDANPFFHLVESLWMLAGKNDVATLAYYNSKIGEIASDDGVIFNGAYGRRWRSTYVGCSFDENEDNIDQLPIIIDQLKRKPDSRRVVLQMWNAEEDLLKIDKTKDVCCNTHAYFLLVSGKLNMTVCNRSNDLIWGALGANVVHFSFLQEYLAAAIGVGVGNYYQFTNNLHAYQARWNPSGWMSDSTPDYYSQYQVAPARLVAEPERFDRECKDFVNGYCGEGGFAAGTFQEPFINYTAWPMVKAWRAHKARNYPEALRYCSEIVAADWRRAATDWVNKRKADYENEQDGKNPYLENELTRVATSPK